MVFSQSVFFSISITIARTDRRNHLEIFLPFTSTLLVSDYIAIIISECKESRETKKPKMRTKIKFIMFFFIFSRVWCMFLGFFIVLHRGMSKKCSKKFVSTIQYMTQILAFVPKKKAK